MATASLIPVRPERFRIPDIAVRRSSDSYEPILTAAPLICIEILSPEDRLHRIAGAHRRQASA